MIDLLHILKWIVISILALYIFVEPSLIDKKRKRISAPGCAFDLTFYIIIIILLIKS